MSLTLNIIILVVLLLFLFAISWSYRHPGKCIIDPMLEKLKRDLIKVDTRAATLQYFPSDESYTEDKEKVFLCMKDEKGNYFPYNDLIQVGLHELAHAFTTVIDQKHETPEFNNMHNELRQKAARLGLFDPEKSVAPTYCPKK